MITYKPFWDYLKKKNISTYKLIYSYGINSYTIDRLRHDKPLKTTSLNDLCNRLHCDLPDIILYTADENETDELTP